MIMYGKLLGWEIYKAEDGEGMYYAWKHGVRVCDNTFEGIQTVIRLKEEDDKKYRESKK